MDIRVETEYLLWAVGEDGRNLHFTDKRTGQDYGVRQPGAGFARVEKEGRSHQASAVSLRDGQLQVEFESAGARALIRVEARARYLVLEVLQVYGEGVDELVFADIHLDLEGRPGESFAGCALALDLQTQVPELPGPNRRLRASCYRRFGFAGARAALIGCPTAELRPILQEVVAASGSLPRSAVGGPWALDAPINQGSYLFNFGGVTEETVDEWIDLIRSLGFNQLDFHGGRSFRFGDCHPDPQIYPRGLDSLRAVVDRLHASGIAAGLHTYAFFIDKQCPWVTPLPDPRLGKDATFTLAAALGPRAARLRVRESTESMSATTGFFVRNSATLQVEDELITYTGVSGERPYGFTGCQRGACGTRPSAHPAGAAVHHLKECFGLFAPDPDTGLLAEVAARTAEAFNVCGFDMIYLDALDGEDVLGGGEHGWHYGSRFVYELWQRLEKPALMEMSTFHHHLWAVRSRLGAWDHPSRSHKRFIDIHCQANQECRRIFLPGQLGWWAVKTWAGPQLEPTYPDDLEYLCGKALATDTGLSLMGIDPDSARQVPALLRLAALIAQYETLRHSGRVPDSVKARLRVPGEDFSLSQEKDGRPCFQPVQYARHKVEAPESWSRIWTFDNRFGPQLAGLRLEALTGVGSRPDEDCPVLAGFDDLTGFGEPEAAEGVEAHLRPADEPAPDGGASGCLVAASRRPDRQGAWARVGQVRFAPPLDLRERQGLGVWVWGDGQGEVLNLQVRSPEHLVSGIGEHYVVVDFSGWRYFELVEPEGQRYSEYTWPYGSAYAVYRESVHYEQVESLGLWYNHLPAGHTATCRLGPVRAVPLVDAVIRRPALAVDGRRLVFPVDLETGSYLEFQPPGDARVYGRKGELLCQVRPEGDPLFLAPGENRVEFTCQAHRTRPRVQVTLSSRGEPFPAV